MNLITPDMREARDRPLHRPAPKPPRQKWIWEFLPNEGGPMMKVWTVMVQPAFASEAYPEMYYYERDGDTKRDADDSAHEWRVGGCQAWVEETEEQPDD